MIGVFGPGGFVVPVVIAIVHGPTKQLEPSDTPDGEPCNWRRTEIVSVAAPVNGFSVPVPAAVGLMFTVRTAPDWYW